MYDSRKKFIKQISLASLSLCFGINCQNNNRCRLIELDEFGGWTGKKFESSGYFRTEFDGLRWWFVTPRGNAFISFGVNHFHQDWWAQSYNIDHWLKSFSSTTFLDENWNIGFRNRALSDIELLGFNTIGMHTNAPNLIDLPFKAKVPYLREYKPIVLDHYRNPQPDVYIDIFSDSFEEYCFNYADEITKYYKNDPMLLGYCMADCPIFTEDDLNLYGGTSWARKLRNLGPSSPGKQKYVSTMKNKYIDIEDFNFVYMTTFKSWDELASARDWRKNEPPLSLHEKEDSQKFMLSSVSRYYSVAKKALFHFDSNHLFFGDKINANTDSLEKVIKVISEYVDVIYYQNFATCVSQNEIIDSLTFQTELPFLNGDTGFGVSYDMMPNPYGPRAKNQAERAAWLIDCCETLISRYNFIGWHVCGMIDTWKTMPSKEEHQHQGLMDIHGNYYPEMLIAVQKISSGLYKISNQ